MHMLLVVQRIMADLLGSLRKQKSEKSGYDDEGCIGSYLIATLHGTCSQQAEPFGGSKLAVPQAACSNQSIKQS